MRKVGFIGLGNMGFGMTTNLTKSGFEVFGCDVNKYKLNEAVKAGVKRASSIEEVGRETQTVILALPHLKTSQKIIKVLSSTKNVKVVIDTSTLTPEVSSDIYKEVKKKGASFLCAPMLGGKNAALNKKIIFLVEGDKNIFQENKDLFEAMGSRADYMGKPPTATVAKLAYNICRYGNIATAVETIRFTRKYVSNTESIYKILEEGSLENFGKVWSEDIKNMMLTGKEYKPSHIPGKDLSLIINLAKNKRLSDKLFKAVRSIYKSLSI